MAFNQFAAELDLEATKLEAAALARPPMLTTHEQQQVQQQAAEVDSDGIKGKD